MDDKYDCRSDYNRIDKALQNDSNWLTVSVRDLAMTQEIEKIEQARIPFVAREIVAFYSVLILNDNEIKAFPSMEEKKLTRCVKEDLFDRFILSNFNFLFCLLN